MPKTNSLEVIAEKPIFQLFALNIEEDWAIQSACEPKSHMLVTPQFLYQGITLSLEYSTQM
jgi:hypothetical protein